jgi:lysophospholipase L1-like esterase
MRSRVGLCFLVSIVMFGLGPYWVGATDYDLYILGGQSNMDGYGRVEDLPEGLNEPVDGVMIFHGNTSADATGVDGRGVWAELQPGHGVGYKTDGLTATHSDRFGVELTFAQTLQKLDPDTRIAIIKYSKGGSSIDREAAKYSGCWAPDYPGINQYDHFLATVRNATAVADIDGDGEKDTLVPRGIVWMQGESDAAYTAVIAERYEAQLEQLMDLIRAALLTDDLPVVIGRISDSGQDNNEQDGMVWNHGGIVRAAQASYVTNDGHAALVISTDDYAYSDPWHYDSAGYIDLGKEFAVAVHGLQPEPSSTVADPDPLRFQTEIDAFARWDESNTPPAPHVLFVGSSSIRYWSTESSFPGCGTLNRGFGGAHISDVLHYYSETVAAYGPRAIVFYAGDNDVAAGKTPTRIFYDFKTFVEDVRRDLPETPIIFLAIKPSGSRWHLWENTEEANALVRTWAESQPDLEFVDVATPMLGDDGTPREDLFVGDRLHMNVEGYVLWNSILRPYLSPYCTDGNGQ